MAEPDIDFAPGWLNTRSELSTLLRSWRMRRSPEDFPDFPQLLHRPRRRSYLTVEDAATLCEVSPAWYRSFESGEPKGYSAEFLERVAAVLNLDEAEREAMFLLATGHAPMPLTAGGIRQFSPGVQVTVDSYDWPAYVLDHTGAILARNHSSLVWFPSQSTENHYFIWLFTNPEARAQFVEWAQVARNCLAYLRAQYARAPQCRQLHETLKAILEASSEIRAIWRTQPHVSSGEDRHVRRLRLPDAPAVTDAETVSSTLDARLGLRLYTLVPVGGYRPNTSPITSSGAEKTS